MASEGTVQGGKSCIKWQRDNTEVENKDYKE